MPSQDERILARVGTGGGRVIAVGRTPFHVTLSDGNGTAALSAVLNVDQARQLGEALLQAAGPEP